MSQGNAKTPKPDARRSRVGGFEIVSKLGQGGMGAVFKAVQLSVARPVALKILPQRLAKNPDFLARFFREARSAARLNHPNIVQAIDAGEADGYHYFAMEFVDGRSAADLVRDGKPLPEKEALRITREIAKALDYAHQAGIIHRDIKPANILLTTSGQAKLADLGLAREATGAATDVTQAGYALGTPDYISPEQVRGDTDLDGRADVYSLGATLFHLLTGKPPYAGGTGNEVMAKHLAESLPDPRQINPAVSRSTARIIWKAMAKNRDHRYRTAGEMASDLERALAGGADADARPSRTRGSRPVRSKSRMPMVIGGALAAVLVAIAVVVATWESSPEGDPKVTPPSTSPPAHVENRTSPEASADEEALQFLRQWVQEHPGEYRRALEMYRSAIGRMTQSVVLLKANDDVARIQTARRKAAEAAFEAMKRRSDELAQANRYDDAIAVHQTPPEKFTDLLADRYRAETQTLRDQASRRLNAALEAAEAASAKGRPDEGLAALEQAAEVQFAAMAGQISSMRDRLQKEKADVEGLARKQALAAAKAGVDKLLEQIESAASEGKPREVGHLVENALKDEALQPDAERLRVVARVGQIIAEVAEKRDEAIITEMKKLVGIRGQAVRTRDGVRVGEIKKVSRDGIVLDPTAYINNVRQADRPLITIPLDALDDATLNRLRTPWKPTTPDEHIASAIMALGEKDIEKAETALKGATNHPLEPRYRGYGKRLPEQAAERAWKPIEPYTRRKEFTLPQAAAAIRLLKAFEKEHGKTQFARSVENKAKELRKRAEPALEIVIDNDDPSIKVWGSWTISSYYPGYYGKNYLHDGNAEKGNKSVSYIPEIAEPGNYEVFAYYPTHRIYASKVPVKIIHAKGTELTFLNQREGEGQWVSLGSYPFARSKTGRVIIQTANTQGYVAADAIKFVFQP